MSGEMIAWAKTHTHVTHKAFTVLGVLAELADEYGIANASIKTLTARAKLSRASVFRAINELEAAGLVRREGQEDPNFGTLSSYFILLAHDSYAKVSTTWVENLAYSRGDKTDAQWFTFLVDAAYEQDWSGVAADELAEVLNDWAKRAAPVVAAKTPDHVMDVDTMRAVLPGMIWEEIVKTPHLFIHVEKPWSYLSKIASRKMAALTARQAKQSTYSGVKDDNAPLDSLDRLTDLLGVDAFSTDNIEAASDNKQLTMKDLRESPDFRKLAHALKQCGVDESIAWSLIARLYEHSKTHPTRAYTQAAKDDAIKALGFHPDASKQLLKLILGSREDPQPVTSKGKPATRDLEDIIASRDNTIFTLTSEEVTTIVAKILKTPTTQNVA